MYTLPALLADQLLGEPSILNEFPARARPYILESCRVSISGDRFVGRDCTVGLDLLKFGLSVLPEAIRNRIPSIDVQFACLDFPNARCLVPACYSRAYIGLDMRLFLLIWRVAHYVLLHREYTDLQIQQRIHSCLKCLVSDGVLPTFDNDKGSEPVVHDKLISFVVSLMEMIVIFHEVGHIVWTGCQTRVPCAGPPNVHNILFATTRNMVQSENADQSAALLDDWAEETFCDLFAKAVVKRFLADKVRDPPFEWYLLNLSLCLLFHLLDTAYLCHLSHVRKRDNPPTRLTGSHPPPFFRLTACQVPHELWNPDCRHDNLRPDYNPDTQGANFGKICRAFDYLTTSYGVELFCPDDDASCPEEGFLSSPDFMWRVEWQYNGTFRSVSESLKERISRVPHAEDLRRFMVST